MIGTALGKEANFVAVVPVKAKVIFFSYHETIRLLPALFTDHRYDQADLSYESYYAMDLIHSFPIGYNPRLLVMPFRFEGLKYGGFWWCGLIPDPR